MDCKKRQTIMSKDGTQLRCLNRECPAWGVMVTEEACGMCEHRVTHKMSCKEVQTREAMTPDEKALVEHSEKWGIHEEIEKTPDGAPPPEYPNWSIQAWLYKEALIRWKKAGYPTRDQEEVDRIHKDHCLKCDWYDPDKKRCKGCGCRVTDGAVAVVNKIKMATEHCPKEVW